jgi:Flp pilus assembly protein TadB
VVSSRKKRDRDATPDVPSITNAPEPLADDIARRQVRYLIQMGIRVVCFILAVVTWHHLPVWVSIIFIIAAVVLPYFAVIGANAGRERQDEDASYLDPREIGPGHGQHGELGGRR